jgi:hypothetical protein
MVHQLLFSEKKRRLSLCQRSLLLLLAHLAALLVAALPVYAQRQCALEGTVVDDSGSVISHARVKIYLDQNLAAKLHTDELGHFAEQSLAPGLYSIRISQPGFTRFKQENLVLVAGRSLRVSVTLHVRAERERVLVSAEPVDAGSLEPIDNSSAMNMREEDLAALPDDPEEMEADLRALAGTGAGSGPANLYLDGFSNGRVPPKESIREIHINQNPFAAEYDKVGFGRIEILTKPAGEKFHGDAGFRISDAAFNSRNPFSANKPPYQARTIYGDIGGPLNKQASFFLNFERRAADDNAVINATILNSLLQSVQLMQAVVTPSSADAFGGRIDYVINPAHTLSGRYSGSRFSQTNAGVGGLALASQGFRQTQNAHMFQLAETAILSPVAINEARIQLIRSRLGQQDTNPVPGIQVLGAFNGGGAQIGNAFHAEDRWEFQNSTTVTSGTSTLKFGGRLRSVNLSDRAPANFGGVFTFSGGLGPQLDANNHIVLGPTGNPVLVPVSSIERYRRTLLFQEMGFAPAAIRAFGGGASQFLLAGGQPASSLKQTDADLFIQDDWHLSPTLLVSAGLRWEGQTHIHDWMDFAPRVGLAWMPGASKGNTGKTVIRLGGGIFYDRFNEDLVLSTLRFDGTTQKQFVVDNPNFFPQVPPINYFENLGLPQTIRTLASGLRAPYLMEGSASVERQLPLHTVLSVTYNNLQGRHLLMSRNMSSILPAGAFNSTGNNYQYQSDGTLNENQVVVSLNRRFGSGMSFFSRYSYTHALGNTDGANTFPANQLDLSADYGRTATDIRHNVVLGSSFPAPFGLRLSPFLVARSGAPFNITTGHDNNGDSLFTDRPAFAKDPSKPSVVATSYGLLDTRPSPGAIIIPHNFGQGPSFFSVNLRLSKSFGFGHVGGENAPSNGNRGDGSATRHAGRSGLFSLIATGAEVEHRYNFTFSVTARNLFNAYNPGVPVGNLSSPNFGRSNWLASSAGPEDAISGNNRRIQFDLRFSF